MTKLSLRGARPQGGGAPTVQLPQSPYDVPYDVMVFIGRFRPLHLGHQRVVDRALALGRTVVMLVGSANASRSLRNAFSHDEVVAMVAAVYPQEVADGRLVLLPLDDCLYNDALWLERTQATVRRILDRMPGNAPQVTVSGWNDFRIALIGCRKDHTSYYLRLFPTWASEGVDFLTPINATDIRTAMFERDTVPESQVPAAVADWLSGWMTTDAFRALQREYRFIKDYKAKWAGAPYAPSFNAADAVVVQSGHVLLVRRRAMPGEGLLALPGGFIRPTESAFDAAVRELKEETRLRIDKEDLKRSLVAKDLFDDPNRSMRGRTYSHAFYFKLADQVSLPKVRGGDDAAHALWVPLGLIDPRDMFEDHWHIINAMVGGLP